MYNLYYRKYDRTDLTLKRYVLKTLRINNHKCDYRLINELPQYLNDTLVGLLLSDGVLQRSRDTSNIRLNIILSVKIYP